jgi:isoleucyl-tRNA synthetase
VVCVVKLFRRHALLDEILQRVSDGYRKLRNTARFALGNLHGFDPARDSVPSKRWKR